MRGRAPPRMCVRASRKQILRDMRHLNVLIACEESQAECTAFREMGHNAYSCDLQPCGRGGHKEWHIIADVRRLLRGSTEFKTMDGKRHHLSKWHLIIAHPPCTYLCKASGVQMRKNGEIQPERYAKMLEAKEFFIECLNANAPFVAVENPIPLAIAELPRPSCFAEPYWFGSDKRKKTLYWLKNLPPLMPTCVHPQPRSLIKMTRDKYRSRTDPYLAKAIASQWGQYVAEQLKINVDRT